MKNMTKFDYWMYKHRFLIRILEAISKFMMLFGFGYLIGYWLKH